MCLDVSYAGESLLGIVVKHLEDEVFELVGGIAQILHEVQVGRLLCCHEVVVVVLLVGLGEWRRSVDHDEEDHG